MEKFCYNPFHFVPVTERSKAQRQHDLDRVDLTTEAAGSTTHERYVVGTHSGRLVCKLTTKTPTVIGAKQKKRAGQSGEVTPYFVTRRGDTAPCPAIPASTLRGLFSSLAEAASNSAMRVLGGGQYSFRKPFKPEHTLSAIGLIVRGPGGIPMLRPAALPTLTLAEDRSGRSLGYYFVPPRFKTAFPKKPALKVYLGDYDWIRKDHGYRTSLNGVPSLDWNIPQLSYNPQGHLNDDPSLYCKPNPENRKFAVSQAATDEAAPRPGLLRILGCWGERTAHIPESRKTGKKHELWIPAPGPDAPTLKIAPLAIERFNTIADERTEESLKAGNPVMPFHPLDTARNESPKELGQKFRLKAGDLVYFDLDESGVVTEIALSAIWRGRVEAKDGSGAGAAEFFEAVDPNLLPFSPKRKWITIAERMFGFVGETEKKEETDEQGLSLASRIRISDGLPAVGVSMESALEDEFVTLRILSSPKPPSPALYFKPGKGPGRSISKVDLKPTEHHPQGRKMYLHQFVKPEKQPWETARPGKNPDQKNRVRPIRRDQEFFFHIDFENLTDAEVGLLLYAISPNEKFHHKIGMGKPLGLGSVRIEIQEWQVIERAARYSVAGLRAGRYSRTWRPSDEGFWQLRDAVISDGLVSKDVHSALGILGNYSGAPPADQVHTPTLSDQPDAETETYKWFVANDGGLKEGSLEIPAQGQFLRPLSEAGGKLPPLTRPEWKERQRRGRY